MFGKDVETLRGILNLLKVLQLIYINGLRKAKYRSKTVKQTGALSSLNPPSLTITLSPLTYYIFSP